MLTKLPREILSEIYKDLVFNLKADALWPFMFSDDTRMFLYEEEKRTIKNLKRSKLEHDHRVMRFIGKRWCVFFVQYAESKSCFPNDVGDPIEDLLFGVVDAIFCCIRMGNEAALEYILKTYGESFNKRDRFMNGEFGRNLNNIWHNTASLGRTCRMLEKIIYAIDLGPSLLMQVYERFIVNYIRLPDAERKSFLDTIHRRGEEKYFRLERQGLCSGNFYVIYRMLFSSFIEEKLLREIEFLFQMFCGVEEINDKRDIMGRPIYMNCVPYDGEKNHAFKTQLEVLWVKFFDLPKHFIRNLSIYFKWESAKRRLLLACEYRSNEISRLIVKHFESKKEKSYEETKILIEFVRRTHPFSVDQEIGIWTNLVSLAIEKTAYHYTDNANYTSFLDAVLAGIPDSCFTWQKEFERLIQTACNPSQIPAYNLYSEMKLLFQNIRSIIHDGRARLSLEQVCILLLKTGGRADHLFIREILLSYPGLSRKSMDKVFLELVRRIPPKSIPTERETIFEFLKAGAVSEGAVLKVCKKWGVFFASQLPYKPERR